MSIVLLLFCLTVEAAKEEAMELSFWISVGGWG
jgi:hypothetical protein